MSANRTLLKQKDLADFTRFAESKGWVREDAKGEYEVLRMMRKESLKPLLVYRRSASKGPDAAKYFTVYGNSERMAILFYRPNNHNVSVDSRRWDR